MGVLLSAFGTLWIGESAGIPWPWGDASIVWIAALYLCSALAAISWVKRSQRVSTTSHRIRFSWPGQVIGFFVDDGINALLTVAWIGVVLAIARVVPDQAWQGVLLAAGLSMLFIISIILRVRRVRRRVHVETSISEEIVSVIAEE